MTPSEWLRRVEAIEARLAWRRVPPAFFVINNPEAGLEEFRLPAEVLEKLGTIKVGLDPS